jgi:enoyl-[acyl-carrier protein] reductase II
VVITEGMKLTLNPMVKRANKNSLLQQEVANGRGNCMVAADVQVGSRFAASMESSAHDNFKKTI